MFLVIFLAAVPAQLLFGVAMMTMPAVLSILTFGLLYGSGVILSVFLLDAIGAPKRREFPPGCSNLEGLARGDPSLEGGTGFQRDIMSSGVYIFVGLGLFGYLEFFLFGYLLQSGPEDWEPRRRANRRGSQMTEPVHASTARRLESRSGQRSTGGHPGDRHSRLPGDRSPGKSR